MTKNLMAFLRFFTAFRMTTLLYCPMFAKEAINIGCNLEGYGLKYPPVAQLDNAADSDSEERGFESLQAGHEKSHFCLPTKATFFNDIRSLWNG